MGTSGFVAVGIGAALGAWLRWGLGVFLNPVFPSMPLGTLVANLVGGTIVIPHTRRAVEYWEELQNQ